MVRLDDCQFGAHDGVTVLTGPGGRLIVPSLRKYDEPVDLSAVAGLFRAQRERDRQEPPQIFHRPFRTDRRPRLAMRRPRLPMPRGAAS